MATATQCEAPRLSDAQIVDISKRVAHLMRPVIQAVCVDHVEAAIQRRRTRHSRPENLLVQFARAWEMTRSKIDALPQDARPLARTELELELIALGDRFAAALHLQELDA